MLGISFCYVEEIIKRKLIYDGDGTAEDRRINQFLKMTSKFILSDESEEETKASCERMMHLVDSLELNRKKSDIVHIQNVKQLELYKQIQSELEAEMQEKREQISCALIEMEKAHKIKDNRILYDMLAKAIKRETPREELLKKQETLEQEIQELQVKKKELDLDIDARKKQFIVLSNAGHNLIKLLEPSSDNDLKDVEEVT